MESAKIWVRYPNSTALPFEELDLALFYRSVLNETDSEWLRGPSALLTHQSDWVGVVQLDGLQANTEYEYAWIVQAADSVRTLPFSQNGRAVTSQQLPPPIEHFRFKTAPVSGNPHDFQFVFGSCIKPNYPYGQGLPGFAAVSRQRPAFLLMLGDFIYIDIVVNFGASLGNYLRHYREVLGQTETVQLLSSTPMYGINDDHEILNNWDRGNTGPFINAMAAFDLYVASANPSLPNGSQSDVSLPKPKYYQFEHGDAAFFVTDTRTFRNPFGGTAAAAVDRSYFDSLPFNHPDRTMLGKQQLKELLGWLQRVNNTHTFKFLVTSVPFTFNFPNDDTWYAYQYERQLILDHIDRNSITNVIVLSGDRHQIAVKDFLYAGSENSSAPLATEFSVSPISQFWVPIPFYFETSNSFSGSSGKRFPDSKWIEDRRVFYSYNVGPINVGKMIVQTERAYESSANPPLPSVTFCLYRPRSTWWWRWLVESWSSLLFDTPLDQETAERCSAGSDSAVDDNNNDQLVYHHTIYGKLIERATGWEQQRNSGGVEQTSTQFPSNDLIDGVWNWMRSLIR
jgi:alkaline phosphatase D